MRRVRSFQVFSLAFLDCICCGFGAMILIFVLTIGKAPERNASVLSELQEAISRISAAIRRTENETADMDKMLKARVLDRSSKDEKRESSKKSVRDLEFELSLMLEKRSALKEELDKLLGEKKAIPTQEEKAPIPIPNEQRRQYLTGFNFEGKYIVFLVEASGGMIGYTVDEVIGRMALSDEDKRKTEKWRRVVRSVQWIVANLGAKQAYQIVTFNKEAKVLVPEKEFEWYQPLDRETTASVLKKLGDVTPQSGGNLERAFTYVREHFPLADGIVLITDSLPTLSDTYPSSGPTDDRERERFFRAAIKEMPKATPVNILLFPMSGDPAAAFLLWQLADSTRGSMISPSQSWPDI